MYKVDVNLIPYMSPEEYENTITVQYGGQKKFVSTNDKGLLEFTGTYGPNLYQEIANYAIVASVLGQSTSFDIIHAHDWLTYPAGIAAKNSSGKPLVVHVHATDFDRSGGNVNPLVYEIEKEGMMAADRVITVSNLTRNIVIEKYGIDPNKVFTVYNAVEPVATRNILKLKKVSTKK